MTTDRLAPYILIIGGIVIFFLGFPRLRSLTVGRLQNADILPRKKLKPKDRELFSGAGPDLSLMLCGLGLIILGIIELLYS